MSQTEKFLWLPKELTHLVVQILTTCFDFNIPFQVTSGKLILLWRREEIGGKEGSL